MGLLSLAAEDELGPETEMLRYPGTSMVAGTLRFVFGAPIDTFDWIFHSAWNEDTTMAPLEIQPAPALPGAPY
ncbi:MAG: hypothetical protein AAF196_03745 [Planctomycetota bacterium]